METRLNSAGGPVPYRRSWKFVWKGKYGRVSGKSLSKSDVICPLAIPIQNSRTPQYQCTNQVWRNLLMYTQVIIRKRKYGRVSGRFLDKICPLAIPNQISTLSMHISNLMKIHWCLLKLSSRNEKQMDGRRMDRQTHRSPTWNHNTPPLYSGGV